MVMTKIEKVIRDWLAKAQNNGWEQVSLGVLDITCLKNGEVVAVHMLGSGVLLISISEQAQNISTYTDSNVDELEEWVF